MRVAQIAPLYETVPPERYGGTERVIAGLCDALVARDHEVTLFAAAGSVTSAQLEASGPPLRERMSRQELVEVAPHLHLNMLTEIYQRADEFDIIHSHVDIWTLPFAARSSTPSILTMHGRLDTECVQTVMPLYPQVPLVSVSTSQREPLRGKPITWAATVYNGLDLGTYGSATCSRQDHLAFVGRISPEKGPTLAIEIARRANRPLRLAAKVDPMDVDYFEGVVEPLLGRDAEFVGELNEQQKPSFYASAAATLFPSDWPEPFGLVMIESLAAGTPVIALRRGAVPEVLVDGEHGFICDDIDEMVAAVGRLGEIDPEVCRARAAEFSNEAMCAGYESAYASIRHKAERAPSSDARARGSVR